MMTLKEKAIALSVVALFNLGVLLLLPIYLLLSVPVSVLFAVALLHN